MGNSNPIAQDQPHLTHHSYSNKWNSNFKFGFDSEILLDWSYDNDIWGCNYRNIFDLSLDHVPYRKSR
jgi:hypothetical protein